MSHPANEMHYLCSELVSLVYKDRQRNTRQALANLEEISSTEAILLAGERLEPGAAVSLCAKGQDLDGQVECCAFYPVLGWFVKIALNPDSRWNSRVFVPDHFVALCVSAFSDLKKAA